MLNGPLVHRHDALWNGSGFEPYELWELDIPTAIDLVDRLGTKPAHTSRRSRLTKAELSQELARQLEWEHCDPGSYTSLDSLGMVELLVTIADLAGTDPPDDTLTERMTSIDDAFALYQRLRTGD